jgi:putative endonuclease
MTTPIERRGASRRAAFRLGLSAESRAAAWLVAKGYRVLARRWRCRGGEIDIVARRGRRVIFVEVKARQLLTQAAEAIEGRQQHRVVTAAEAWLVSHPEHASYEFRFDAILIAPWRWPLHIRDAFDAGG